MRQRTHVVIAVASGMMPLAVRGQMAGPEVPLYAGMLVLGALLPDLDTPASILRRRARLLGCLLALLPMRHRTMTHSLLALGLLVAVVPAANPVWLSGLAVGYGLHVLADMTTFSGVPLLWPVSRRAFHLVPRRLRVRAAGTVDDVLFAACGTAALMCLVMWLSAQELRWLS